MKTTKTWEQETEQSWSALEQRLVSWLVGVPPDGTVQVGLSWPDDGPDEAAPFVRVTVEGLWVRSEAPGNCELAVRFRLDDARVEQLVAQGWRTPGGQGSGSLSRDDELPSDAVALAEVLVVTLREVYGVPAPSFLVASGHDADGQLRPALLPFGLTVDEPESVSVGEPEGRAIDLTARLAADPDDLRELVAQTVSKVLDEQVDFDPDGDIPVPAGETVVYVRVEENSPVVTFFAAVLREVRWAPRVGHTLNEVNLGIRFGRVVFHGGHVLLEYHLFARPFVPELLRHALAGMTALVADLETELPARIGGSLLGDRTLSDRDGATHE